MIIVPRGTFILNRGIRIRTGLLSDYARLHPVSTDAGKLKNRILDGCVLLAESNKGLLASVAVDLDLKKITALNVDRAQAPDELGGRMIASAERLAVRFGILDLRVIPSKQQVSLFHSCGYREDHSADGPSHGGGGPVLHRSFPRRQTRYSRQIADLLTSLGIERDYARSHRIPLQEEATVLSTTGPDVYGREQHMLPPAANAWLNMKTQAGGDGVELQAVSAFRSVSYQEGIVRRKLDKGQSLTDILKVSAAPGFSEHHSGRAMDITTPDYPVLEEEFEKSAAFEWLQAHAGKFDFHLSFPRNNRHGVAYEPWHWAWRT